MVSVQKSLPSDDKKHVRFLVKASKPYLIGEMNLIQSKYTGMVPLLTKRPEKIINGNNTMGVIASATVKSGKIEAKKMPADTRKRRMTILIVKHTQTLTTRRQQDQGDCKHKELVPVQRTQTQQEVNDARLNERKQDLERELQ